MTIPMIKGKKRFVTRLEFLRAGLGYNLSEMAKRVGICKASLRRLEGTYDTTARSHVMFKLEEYFKMPFDELMLLVDLRSPEVTDDYC